MVKHLHSALILFAAITALPGLLRAEGAGSRSSGQSRIAAAYREPISGHELVTIPAGCFIMGDTYGDGQGDEKPLHEVCLDSFMIGRYEVTNAQYRTFRPDHSSGSYAGNSLNGDNQPVTGVSWHDAVAYANWLTGKSGVKFRLPSEAEWEYAARGGSGSRNYWGDDPALACKSANGADLSARAQWPEWTTTECNDSYRVSAPVGMFAPNAYGVYDIMGNAWEWTADWYDAEYYFESPGQNPKGPAQGKLKVPRGGGWGNASECVRVSDRNGFAPDFSILFLGFRLAASPVAEKGK